jgi:hypothetical protein
LARSGRIEILDDFDLYAWSRRAAVEAAGGHLPMKVQQWERAARGAAFELIDVDPPVEPALRQTGTLSRLSDDEDALVDAARAHALAWADERPMLPDFPVLFECAVMGQFTNFLRDRQAPNPIPAHHIRVRGLQTVDEALARRTAWREAAPTAPIEEIR